MTQIRDSISLSCLHGSRSSSLFNCEHCINFKVVHRDTDYFALAAELVKGILFTARVVGPALRSSNTPSYLEQTMYIYNQ